MKTITIVISSCILFLVSSLKAQEATLTPTLTPKTDSLPKKVKEFGIGFTSLTAYSLQYRWGNTKRLFRINATIGGSTAFGNGTGSSNQIEAMDYNNNNTTTSTTNTPLNFSTSLSFSILNTKYIAKKFGLIYGPVAGISYSIINSQSNITGNAVNQYSFATTNNGIFPINNSTKTESVNFQPYLGFVLGAFYKINKSFFLYAEIAPNIYYARTNNTLSTTNSNYNSGVNYSSTNNTATFNNTFGVANLSNSAATITIVYRITKPNKTTTLP